MSVLGVCSCRILLLACVLLEAGAVKTGNTSTPMVLNLGFLTSKTGSFISSGALVVAFGRHDLSLCVRNVRALK